MDNPQRDLSNGILNLIKILGVVHIVCFEVMWLALVVEVQSSEPLMNKIGCLWLQCRTSNNLDQYGYSGHVIFSRM